MALNGRECKHIHLSHRAALQGFCDTGRIFPLTECTLGLILAGGWIPVRLATHHKVMPEAAALRFQEIGYQRPSINARVKRPGSAISARAKEPPGQDEYLWPARKNSTGP